MPVVTHSAPWTTSGKNHVSTTLHMWCTHVVEVEACLLPEMQSMPMSYGGTPSLNDLSYIDLAVSFSGSDMSRSACWAALASGNSILSVGGRYTSCAWICLAPSTGGTCCRVTHSLGLRGPLCISWRVVLCANLRKFQVFVLGSESPSPLACRTLELLGGTSHHRKAVQLPLRIGFSPASVLQFPCHAHGVASDTSWKRSWPSPWNPLKSAKALVKTCGYIGQSGQLLQSPHFPLAIGVVRPEARHWRVRNLTKARSRTSELFRIVWHKQYTLFCWKISTCKVTEWQSDS